MIKFEKTIGLDPLLLSLPLNKLIFGVRDEIQTKIRAKLVGAVGYISKPCNPQELVNMVNGYLGKKESNSQNQFLSAS